MNLALRPQAWPPPILWFGALVLFLPMMLAGGPAKETPTNPTLLEEESYRSDPSAKVRESSQWRSKGQQNRGWREPPPASGPQWRMGPPSPNQTGSTNQNVELFPKYTPGDPAVFDHTSREEKGQIKVFEFGR